MRASPSPLQGALRSPPGAPSNITTATTSGTTTGNNGEPPGKNSGSFNDDALASIGSDFDFVFDKPGTATGDGYGGRSSLADDNVLFSSFGAGGGGSGGSSGCGSSGADGCGGGLSGGPGENVGGALGQMMIGLSGSSNRDDGDSDGDSDDGDRLSINSNFMDDFDLDALVRALAKQAARKRHANSISSTCCHLFVCMVVVVVGEGEWA